MLYHASPISGIIRLEPRVSTHGKKWVYAVSNRLTALLFGAKQDDFDLKIDTEQGVPVVFECYPDALEAIYRDKACSLYTLPEEGFLKGKTEWDEELVSPEPVAVCSEEYIPDLYAALEMAAERGECVLHRYERTSAYRAMISNHVADRLFRFGVLDGPISDPRLTGPFARLVCQLQDALSGKYLE